MTLFLLLVVGVSQVLAPASAILAKRNTPKK
jgi:hypothetical protein